MHGDHQPHPSHREPSDPGSGAPQGQHDLLATLYANQCLWLQRLATGDTLPAIDHPRLWQKDGLTAARTGRTGVICLHETHETIENPERTLETLQAAWPWLREHGSGDVLVWSATARPDLDLPLLARGLDTSFVPRWMTRGLSGHLPRSSPNTSIHIHLARAPDFESLRTTSNIPYVSADQLPQILELVRKPARSRRVLMLVAREQRALRQSEVLGQAIVNISDGPAGRFAGLYNLGVHNDARNRGIGTALTIAACNLARDLGARCIGMNATPDGERIYQALQFRHLGDGQTWLLPGRRLANPPARDIVDLAMSIGQGTPTFSGRVPAVLPNGETPLTFAARFANAHAMRWLLAHGSAPEIVPLWIMGFRAEFLTALGDPAAVNRRIPPTGTTPLHEAARRGDTELVQRLIAAGADLTLKDDRYRSTPLGWAEALGREEIAAMLRQAATV
jgi:ribosomal protein S18 acetylase RimI-like enzyme